MWRTLNRLAHRLHDATGALCAWTTHRQLRRDLEVGLA